MHVLYLSGSYIVHIHEDMTIISNGKDIAGKTIGNVNI